MSSKNATDAEATPAPISATTDEPVAATSAALTPGQRLARVREQGQRVRGQIASLDGRVAQAQREIEQLANRRRWMAEAARRAEQAHTVALGALTRAAAELDIVRGTADEPAARQALDAATRTADAARTARDEAAQLSRETTEETTAEEKTQRAAIFAATAERGQLQQMVAALDEAEAGALEGAARERIAELRAEVVQRMVELRAARDALVETCQKIDAFSREYALPRLHELPGYAESAATAEKVLRPYAPGVPVWLRSRILPEF